MKSYTIEPRHSEFTLVHCTNLFTDKEVSSIKPQL